MPRSRKDRAPSPGAPTPQVLQLRPIISADEDTQTFYINYAEVGCSAHEFAILAARLPTKYSAASLDEFAAVGHMPVIANVQLLFSPTLIEGLIQALNTQKEFYEQHFGKAEDSGEQGDAKSK